MVQMRSVRGSVATDQPNVRLAEVLRQLDCSNKGLARRVRDVAARHGVIVKTDHVTVKRWLDGAIPHPDTCAFIAEALSAKAGYRITLDDLGMSVTSPHASLDGALEYPDDIERAYSSLAALTRFDLADDPIAVASEITPAAWPKPLMTWLLARPQTVPVQVKATRRVGMSDLEAVRTTTQMFMRIDFQFGGGHARAALAQYFNTDVLPLLNGSFTESTGRALFSASAEVAQLLGWTAYDLGRHGIAQRYLIQALRLAQAGNDRVMGGRILSNMSHQATYLGRFQEAQQLARAAQEGSKGAAGGTVQSMLLAMEARALAGCGDERGCSVILREAESAFERRNTANDPVWISYFDDAELAGEAAHCFRDLRRPDLAQEFVAKSVQLSEPFYVRALSFMRFINATSWLHGVSPDPDRAVSVALEAIELAGSLKSERYLRYLRDFCGDCGPYGSLPAVREFLQADGCK